MKGIDVVKMATEFHSIYETEAIEIGWATQDKCKVPFDECTRIYWLKDVIFPLF